MLRYFAGQATEVRYDHSENNAYCMNKLIVRERNPWSMMFLVVTHTDMASSTKPFCLMN